MLFLWFVQSKQVTGVSVMQWHIRDSSRQDQENDLDKTRAPN